MLGPILKKLPQPKPRYIKDADIENEFTGCVYCYWPKNEKISCCGENHFDRILDLVGTETVLASEVIVLGVSK